MSQMTDVAENDFIDTYARGQATTRPTSWVHRLFTAAPGETGGGTEASYTGYAAVTQTASLANYAGTQGAGTTTASTGTSGTTSNNNALTFGTPNSGTSQTVTHQAWCAGTTPWFYGALTTPRTINNGDVAPVAAAGAMQLTAA